MRVRACVPRAREDLNPNPLLGLEERGKEEEEAGLKIQAVRCSTRVLARTGKVISKASTTACGHRLFFFLLTRGWEGR